MEFTSTEEIKAHFGIETSDIDELRKQLKAMLAEVHPDKTGGEYQSRKQQRDYQEVAAAIEYIDNTDTSLTLTRKEWSNMLQKMEELAVFKSKNDVIVEEEFTKQLDTSINTSVIKFQKRHYVYKISSLVVATIITTLWGFPSLIENHKVLSKFIYPETLWFTIFWFGSLLLTSMIWIYSKILERRDDVIKKKYNLDSTQNSIFKLFLAWLQAGYSHATEYDHKNDKHIFKFTKDDVVNFILNYFERYYKEFGHELTSSRFDLYRSVYNHHDKDKKKVLEHPDDRRKTSHILVFFRRPGEIDIDLAQKIADTIIAKLVNRGLVTISKKRTFSETYNYMAE